MVGTKSILESKTFRGVALSFLALILKNFDIDIGNQEMLVNDILQFVGLAFALYGRVSATQLIK